MMIKHCGGFQLSNNKWVIPFSMAKWFSVGTMTKHILTHLGSDTGSDPNVTLCGVRLYGEPKKSGIFNCKKCQRLEIPN